MSKIVRIYNIEHDKQGEPFTACKDHLEWLKRKFVIIELGVSREPCSYSDHNGKHEKITKPTKSKLTGKE